MQSVTLIPGDGIGLEISKSMQQVVEATGAPIKFEEVVAGQIAYETTGELLPANVLESISRNKIAIKGPITTPIGKGFRSINVQLRKEYDLYTNMRPVQSHEGVETRYENIDHIIFRENTEDLYAGKEEKISDDEMHSIKVITRQGSERIARKAFEYAEKTGAEKVTVVTKANIMKLTDGLFLDVAREVASEYTEIELEEVLIDNMCMQLVMYPERYHIILTQNLYGDILSDLCAGLVGGLGLIPGANIGDDIAIFEAVHGSAPDIAGQNKANPTALILSAVMMLEHMDLQKEADMIRTALEETLKNPATRTADVNGTATTTEFTEALIGNLKK
ncbi:NAD-dependent isocitrate dehydrogenase [Aerococcaceae bacterium DSM 111022]|nr:NAD-dependent isocitrate dehydrogenase [Aerococcaceae bacterium DSM 111022]